MDQTINVNQEMNNMENIGTEAIYDEYADRYSDTDSRLYTVLSWGIGIALVAGLVMGVYV